MMSRLRIERKSRWHAAAAYAGLALIAGSLSLFACAEAEVPDEEAEQLYEPAKLEPMPETDVQRVKFTAKGAEQVGVETAKIGQEGQGKVIPYAAVIYFPEGKTFTYTSPEPLTYVRQEIEIDHIDGDRVVISDGPPAGTEVVTVGAAEVYGTEFEVAH